MLAGRYDLYAGKHVLTFCVRKRFYKNEDFFKKVEK